MRLNEIDKLYELQALKGSNAKKAFLKANEKDEAFKTALKFAIDTNVVSGIASKKLLKNIDIKVDTFTSLPGLLTYITNNNTGKDVDVAIVQAFAAKYDEKTRQGIYDVVSQNFKTGIDVNNANAVYGTDFVKQFKVALCEKFWDDPDYWDGKTFEAQQKMDGYRLILIKENGKVSLFSRSGKAVEGLVNIEEEAAKLPYDNFVLDGERQPFGFENMNSKEAFRLTSNSMKKGDKRNMCMVVYDYIPLADWNKQHCSMTRSERYAEYHAMLGNNKTLVALDAMYIGNDLSKLDELFKEVIANELEGLIVKDVNAMYEWDRTQSMCKLKAVYDADLKVTGFKEGTGKHAGRLGSLEVDYLGNPAYVGSGLSDEMRAEVWNNRDKYLGMTAEVLYMEESTDKNGKKSIRHPRFKCWKLGD